jgi:hypothetical protein
MSSTNSAYVIKSTAEFSASRLADCKQREMTRKTNLIKYLDYDTNNLVSKLLLVKRLKRMISNFITYSDYSQNECTASLEHLHEIAGNIYSLRVNDMTDAMVKETHDNVSNLIREALQDDAAEKDIFVKIYQYAIIAERDLPVNVTRKNTYLKEVAEDIKSNARREERRKEAKKTDADRVVALANANWLEKQTSDDVLRQSYIDGIVEWCAIHSATIKHAHSSSDSNSRCATICKLIGHQISLHDMEEASIDQLKSLHARVMAITPHVKLSIIEPILNHIRSDITEIKHTTRLAALSNQIKNLTASLADAKVDIGKLAAIIATIAATNEAVTDEAVA